MTLLYRIFFLFTMDFEKKSVFPGSRLENQVFSAFSFQKHIRKEIFSSLPFPSTSFFLSGRYDGTQGAAPEQPRFIWKGAMTVKIIRENQTMTVQLSGEIDHHSAQDIRSAIDRCAEEYHPRMLVLDFRNVSFMDSSGVGLVLGRYRLMDELGGQLLLRGLPPHLLRVMKLSGIQRLPILIQGGNES